MLTIAFVIPDQCTLLDLAGPVQVFEEARAQGALVKLAYVQYQMGDGYEHLSAAQRQEVLAAFSRTGFKDNILPTFFGGFAHKPETTFGNIKADVAERFIPGYKSPNFCDLVLNSPWSE